MNELINRRFKIWAYTVSHSILILRSPLKYPDQDGYDEKQSYNIDIEFTAVAYIDMPNILMGVSIKESIDVPMRLQHFKDNLDFKIFELISEGKKYHIVAGSYQIGKSKWVSEDRVHNMTLEYDEIIGTS